MSKMNVRAACFAVVLLVLHILFLAGCSTIRVGGYQHNDMSESEFSQVIREQADKLSQSSNSEDIKTAAELYGSIGELDLMDDCVEKYFEQEPSTGIYLMRTAEKIRKAYR